MVEIFDATSLGPLDGQGADPSLQATALTTKFRAHVRKQLPTLWGHANRLRLGSIAALHCKQSFVPDPNLPGTPTAFVAPHDPRSFNGLYAALGLMAAMELQPCAYASENAGEVFQHLVKHPGTGKDAEKSQDELRGHTDAVFHSLHDETRPALSASPDYVVLIGLRNPVPTATRVYAVSRVLKAPHLDATDLVELARSVFLVSPQLSFTGFPPGTAEPNLPVLINHPVRGWQVRYSNSHVAADDDAQPAASDALKKLKDLLTNPPADLIYRVFVEPGDIVFINNRVALHGRDRPADARPGGQTRWLIRTYAIHADTRPLRVGPRDTVLLP